MPFCNMGEYAYFYALYLDATTLKLLPDPKTLTFLAIFATHPILTEVLWGIFLRTKQRSPCGTSP